MTTEHLKCESATLNAWIAALIGAFLTFAAHAADRSIGDTSFNVADRLAVINLVSSYGPLYDQYKMEEWRLLYTEKPAVEFWLGEKKLGEGIDMLSAITRKRQDQFKREGIQRRHLLIPRIISQTADTITGEAYLQLLSSRGDKPSTITTGVYEFTAVNDGNNWKFSRWIAHLDSPLD